MQTSALPSNGLGYHAVRPGAHRAFYALAAKRAITQNSVAFDTGRQHGPTLSAVDCGCGWGALCDTGPFGALCDARPHHGRRGWR